MHAAALIDVTLSLILLAIGMVLRNCVFLGAAALLGISAFYRHMDSFKPGQPIRAALRCISAGAASIVTTIIVGLVLLTGAFGFWPPVDTVALVAGGVVGTITMVIRAALSVSRSPDFELVPMEILVLAAAMLTLGLAAHGIGWIACFYAGAAFAVAGMVGWHLAGETASALLRSGAER